MMLIKNEDYGLPHSTLHLGKLVPRSKAQATLIRGFGSESVATWILAWTFTERLPLR